MNKLDTLRQKEPLFTVLLAAFFLVGTISHLVLPLRPWMSLLTPWVLWAVGILAVVFWWIGSRQSQLILLLWVLSTYALTFVLEALGTHTGLIFGAYTYGQGLGLRLFAVPLVIGFNWTIVVLGIHAWVSRLPHAFLRILATAAGCVFFDVVMEPAAINPRMDYWTWAGGDVPFQNYLAWFVIAALATAWFEALDLKPAGLFAKAFVVIQLAFFLILNVAFYLFNLA